VPVFFVAMLATSLPHNNHLVATQGFKPPMVCRCNPKADFGLLTRKLKGGNEVDLASERFL
jgi:hypothetical protein